MKLSSLNKKNHFDNLRNEEFCITADGLKVFIKENNTLSSRLGISISSKHVNAVNRNKFKRRTREAVRSLSDNKNLDILVVGNKDSSNLTSSEILRIFKSHPLL
mgnify:FL=1